MTCTPGNDIKHNLISPEHRYGCFNTDRPKAIKYLVQNGWTNDGKRSMVDHDTEWLPIGCGHTFKRTDPSCSDCKWR